MIASHPKRSRIGRQITERIAKKVEEKYELTEKIKHSTIRQTAARYKKRRGAERVAVTPDLAKEDGSVTAEDDNVPASSMKYNVVGATSTANGVVNNRTTVQSTTPARHHKATCPDQPWSLPKLNKVANEYWKGKRAQLELYANILNLHKSTFAKHDMGHKAGTAIHERGGVTITHHGSCEVHVVTHEESLYKSTKFISNRLGDTCMNTLVNDTISTFMEAIHHDLHIAAFVVCPEPNEGVHWKEWEAAMSQLWHIDDGVHQTIVHVTDGPKTEYFLDLPEGLPSGNGTKSPGAAKPVVELLRKLWYDTRLNTDKVMSLNPDFWTNDNLNLFFATIENVLEDDYLQQHDSDMWQHIRVLFAIDQELYNDYEVADKEQWAKTGEATVIDGMTIHRGPALNLFRVILLLFSISNLYSDATRQEAETFLRHVEDTRTILGRETRMTNTLADGSTNCLVISDERRIFETICKDHNPIVQDVESPPFWLFATNSGDEGLCSDKERYDGDGCWMYDICHRRVRAMLKANGTLNLKLQVPQREKAPRKQTPL